MIQKWNNLKKTFFFGLFLSFLPLDLSSETILLRNGNVKKGRIVTQDKLTLILEEKEGKTPEVFSKKEILRISYKDLTQAEINQILKESGGFDILDVSPAIPVADPNSGRRTITLGKAFLRSAILPGWGQIYQNRQISSTVYFMLFLGGLGFVAHQQKEFGSDRDDYNYKSKNYTFALYFSGSTAQFLARSELYTQKVQMDNSLHRAEIARGVLAGIYFFNLLDVVIFRPKDNLSLRASALTDQMSLKLEYRF